MIAKKKISEGLLSKHPDLNKEQLYIIISSYIRAINQKLSQNKIVDLTIFGLGRIHNHGRVKDVSKAKRFKSISKWKAKNNKFLDETILF